MKYYVIAGERSGDLHGANLMEALKSRDPEAHFRFWGGDYMDAVGDEMVRHYKDTAFMGIWEVIENLPKIRKFIKQCKQDILHYKPDVLILIDYAGFNLRMAKFAKKHGLKVFYYISPKVWAWYQARAKKIKKNVDKMFVILPFEKEFYKGYHFDVDYVGNPLFDEIRKRDTADQLDKEKVIALLPGSRKQEVIQLLEEMVKVAGHFPDYLFIIAGVSNLPRELYDQFAVEENLRLRIDRTYDILEESSAAIVTSGTATLETALFGVPQVVVYKTSPLTYWVGRLLIKVKYISLVNLIADREVVRELIQQEMNEENLQKELYALLKNPERQREVAEGYELIRERLGEHTPSARTAELILQYLKE